MPRPKYFLFTTSVNKFQIHLFFKQFSTVAEVELIHQWMDGKVPIVGM